jgi:hypothetical protein
MRLSDTHRLMLEAAIGELTASLAAAHGHALVKYLVITDMPADAPPMQRLAAAVSYMRILCQRLEDIQPGLTIAHGSDPHAPTH